MITILKLIEHLQEFQKEKGDIEVKVITMTPTGKEDERGLCPICFIEPYEDYILLKGM
jgi:hypothetical protein